jgi:hypothetical protein
MGSSSAERAHVSSPLEILVGPDAGGRRAENLTEGGNFHARQGASADHAVTYAPSSGTACAHKTVASPIGTQVERPLQFAPRRMS